MTITVGKSCPDFNLESNLGENLSLSDFKGNNVVLYFYPKDNTPGCTIEAQDFNNALDKFEKNDTVIIGISKDSIKSHCNFTDKYNLKFSLLSDPDGEVCESYDVFKEKSMFGKKYMGIERTTLLIDKIGKVAKIWNKVKVKGHVEEVLAELKNL